MRQISFADFKKRIEKNAKKGVYKDPKAKPSKKDSIVVPKDTVVIASSAPALPPPDPVLKSDSLIVLSDLLFELNSAKLRNEHVAALDSLAKFLKSHPTINVSITGHTDSTGTERHNVGLSTRRAEGVSDYLVNSGVDFNRIAFEGFGSSRPIASNRTESGRLRNRRVEILLKKPE